MYIAVLDNYDSYSFTTKQALDNWLNDPRRKEQVISIHKE